MSKPSVQLIPVLNEVFDAQQGKLDANGVRELQSLLRGVLGNRMLANSTREAVEQGDWRLIEGEIRRMMCELDASAGVSNVSVQATSEASAIANVNISAMLEAQDVISKSNELDPTQIDRLVSLLQEAVAAAQSDKPKTVAERLREFLEIGANTATIAQVVGPILLQLGQILSNQPPLT